MPLMRKLRRKIRRVKHKIVGLFISESGHEHLSGNRAPDRLTPLASDITMRLLGNGPESKTAGPLISVLMPVHNVDPLLLNRAAMSVLRQTYSNWQLCMVDDGSSNKLIHREMRAYAAGDSRVTCVFRPICGGISAATNDALAAASGDYIALLDHDDMLTRDALECMAKAIASNDQPDWLYSDECKIDIDDNIITVMAKPDWSPFLLVNSMYTGHLSLYRREAVLALGGLRTRFDLSQDYDLALRMADTTPRVVHVEKVLYAWRMVPQSAAGGGKSVARESNIAALQEAIDRRGLAGRVISPPPHVNRIVRTTSFRDIGISIIVPSDDIDHIKDTIKSILSYTAHLVYEIIVVSNTGTIRALREQLANARVRFVAYDKPFNFSDKCNVGAEHAHFDYIVFFNDDVRVISQNWIETLLEYLTLPGIGGVSLKMLYENATIQYAGMVCGVRRLVGTTAHALPDLTTDCFNLAQSVREVSVLTGALMGMPIRVFRSLGGFDVVNTPIRGSDVDLSLRILEMGLSCLYVPHAKLWHIGHLAIGKAEQRANASKDKSDIYLLKRFGPSFEHDPYFTRAMRELYYSDGDVPFAVYAGVGAPGQQYSRDLLIVTNDLSASGAPRIMFNEALSLKRAGVFVVVVSPTDGPFRQHLVANGVTVIIDQTVHAAPDHAIEFARNFDAVIGNTVLCARLIFSLFGETDSYLYVHEAGLVKKFALQIPQHERLRASALHVWALSRMAAEALRDCDIKSTIMLPGVDDLALELEPQAPRCAELMPDKNKRLQISVMALYLEHRKGQDIAVQAILLLPDTIRSRVRLNLYGRSLDSDFDEKLRVACPTDGSVVLQGEFSPTAAASIMAETDILLVSSREESLSLVTIEAMSLSKPVICSPAAGIADYLDNGVSALIPSENTPEAIAVAIIRLVENETLRRTIGVNGRAIFDTRFKMRVFDAELLKRLGWN